MKSQEGISIVLLISSLIAGGAGKVIAELANQASNSVRVTLVILCKKERLYKNSQKVEVVEPNLTIDQMSRVLFKWRNFWRLMECSRV